MESALFEGSVHHRRSAPVEHAFRYRLFMLYLDLAELDRVFAGRWLWSVEGGGLAVFRRSDHFGDPKTPLDAAVRDLVAAETGSRPEGPIRLLTQLRYFGYCFNPVSFYFCFAADGETLEALVAEVTNTPWQERHCYVLPRASGREVAGELRFETPKEFHVSPFMGMEATYHWRIRVGGEKLGVSIASHAQEGRFFEAGLALRRREIGAASLARALVRHPFMTARISAAIYWEALRLRLRRAPYFPHPGSPVHAKETLPR